MILEFLIVKLIVFFSCHSDVVFSDDDAKLRRFSFNSKKFPDFFLSLVATIAPTDDKSGQHLQNLSHKRDSPCCDIPPKSQKKLHQAHGVRSAVRLGESLTKPGNDVALIIINNRISPNSDFSSYICNIY